MQALRAVLLDMGGVILQMSHSRGFPDGRLDWRGREAMLRLIRRSGGRLELEDLERLVIAPWHRDHQRRHLTGREADWHPWLEQLRRAAGIEVDDLTLLRTWFRPYGDQLQPMAAATETLRQLSDRGLRLALISNVPMPGCLYEEVLERHGLAAPFEMRLFSYDHGTRKPSPVMLRQALDAFAVDAGSAVMVGDRRDRDVAAGLAAGTATIWIDTGDGGGPQADAIIDAVSELPAVLNRLLDA